MRKQTIPAILVLVSLGAVAFLLFINELNISLRLDELKTHLQRLDQREGSIDHIALIATYEIHKKMYEKRLTQESADAIEERVHSLIVREKNYPAVMPSRYKIISLPAIKLINLNRAILGKKPLSYNQRQDGELIDLDIAYYYERNFLFKRAVDQYEKALSNKNIDASLRASMLLHQGYCYALAGMNDSARKNYQTIIRDYNQESIAITATILSKYLEGFIIAREKVLTSGSDPLLQSRSLVNLMAYEQALSILEKAESLPGPKDSDMIRYYKARCYSGLGKPGKAIETYIDIITKSPSSQYAKLSNRKLFIIGSRAGGDNAIRKIAIQMNKRLQDPVLVEMIENEANPEPAIPDVARVKEFAASEKILRQADQIQKSTSRSADTIRYLVIETSDGNTFKGAVMEETNDHITLKSSIGIINVKRDRITRITVKE